MKKAILITVLALAGMNNAQSIGITLDRIQFQVGSNSIEVFPPFSRFYVDNEQAFPPVNPTYSVNWSFSNSEESASLGGSWYVRGYFFNTVASILFTLDEPVDFSLSGYLSQGEWASTSFTSLNASLGSYESNVSVLDTGMPILPALNGILNPGQYLFKINGYAENTESHSGVRLALTPMAIPESGHSILLLGLALGMIGILRLPKALA